jgi:hypothetical protein
MFISPQLRRWGAALAVGIVVLAGKAVRDTIYDGPGAVHAAAIDLGHDTTEELSPADLHGIAADVRLPGTGISGAVSSIPGSALLGYIHRATEMMDADTAYEVISKACQLANVGPPQPVLVIPLNQGASAGDISQELRNAQDTQAGQFAAYAICEAADLADGLNG